MEALAGPRCNALLSEVPQKDRERLARLLKRVTLTFGDVLQETQIIRHVYFPIDCMVSFFAPLSDHLAVEVGLVGSEGMVGAPLALGVKTSAVRAVVQGSGSALEMGAASFERELGRNPVLKTSVHRYIHLLMCQVTQTAACNAFHSIEARCARWLLMTRDRMHSDEVELTHEYLARMLGVRRVGVTVAAGNLQRQGVIAYSRGHITILDPNTLEKIACECYGLVKARYDNPNA